jgi:hypothetical protein
MNSAKVIKLPSHCSSSCLQYENRTKTRKKKQSDCSVGFLTFSFFLLHTKHASSRYAGTEKDIEHTWFREDKGDYGAVLFASPCPLLPFGLIPLLSLLLSQYFSVPSPISYVFP